MTHILTSKIRSDITRELKKNILELIKDPDFIFKICNIQTRKYLPSYTSEYEIAFIITIETNNRALLLGQFVYFKKGGMRGFHNNYLYAKIENLIKSKIKTDMNIDIHFEIVPLENSLDHVYRTLPLDTAISIGLISSKSKLASALRKYKINNVLLAGCEISGPVYGMIKGIEEICENRKINRCLDIFSGTGSLAKVALDNGASFVDCVDTAISDVIFQTLKEHHGKYKIHNMDAYKYNPKYHYDLMIVDPFYDFTLDVTETLLPKLKHFTKFAVLNIGPEIQRYWTSLIINQIEKICSNVDYKHVDENLVALIDFN